MRHLALSAIGRDRPGIVAAVTGVLLRHGANLEDSQMTILRGHFAMTLLVAVPEEAATDRLRSDLAEVSRDLELEALVLSEVEDVDAADPEPTHMVAVYGVDHPGIVHAVTSALAERRVNVTDLNTHLAEEEGEEPLYALLMEVALPSGESEESLRAALSGVAESEGVEVSVRELEQDPL